MLESVRFERYRCFKDATLRLGPLTVLVGPNGSGKTAALSGLNPGGGWGSPENFWRGERSRTRATWVVNGTPSQGPTFRLQQIHLDIAAIRQPNQVNSHTALDSVGSNLTNVFATFPRKRQEAIAGQLCTLVPAFADVDVRPTSSGYHQLYFEDRWKQGLWYTPSQVSDGTMLMLAFIVLTHQQQPPEVLTIEEPERGLHPFLLGELVEMLRALSKGELGSQAIQVVLATHSAELLDHLEPHEVRFLRRNKDDGSTDIIEAKTDTPDWRRAYDEYQQSLGSLWLSGGLGGVPGLHR